MKIHKLMMIRASFSDDHIRIRDACKRIGVPFTKYNNNKNIYVIDLCTVESLKIQKLTLELCEVTPINLNLIKSGFEFKEKIFS